MHVTIGLHTEQDMFEYLLIIPRKEGYPALSLADGPTLRATVRSVLYLALIAPLSLGVATVVRGSATSIGVVPDLLYLIPISPR